MSDTDDTDDLLLIPPDLFVLNTDFEHQYTLIDNKGPYYNIVDKLITQVTDLEDRINTIETTSDISLVSSPVRHHSLESIHNMSSFRKYNSTNDLYLLPQSTPSTPQKPHSKFKLSSLPSSPNDKYISRQAVQFNRDGLISPRKTTVIQRASKAVPSKSKVSLKRDDDVLHQVDNFLCNVKTIKKLQHAARNLENDFDRQNVRTSVDDVEELIEQLDYQQQKNEMRLRQREEALGRISEQVIAKESTYKVGENIESIPDYGMGARHIGTNNHYNSTKPTDKIREQSTDSSIQLNTSQSDQSSPISPDLSSTNSSQTTALNKYDYQLKRTLNEHLNEDQIHTGAINILNNHKKLLAEIKGSKEFVNKEKNKNVYKGLGTIKSVGGLMSLADIWDVKNTQEVNGSTNLHKLSEEKLRRQHCEQLIQELQNKNLELEQKLAVAVKVDASKDALLLQFQHALDEVTETLESLDKTKMNWEDQIAELKTNNQEALQKANEKISQYEQETSKAQNLAQSYQNKISSLENKCTDLQNSLQSIERNFADVRENYSREVEKNRQLSDLLIQKESELKQHKKSLTDARNEVNESRKVVEECQGQFSDLKNECAKLQLEIKEDKANIKALTDQRKKAFEELDAHKNLEKALKDELIRAKSQIETNKVDLRNFYQGQVEILVQNKLKEFQTQLDEAQKAFQEELKSKELNLAKSAASQIQQISEKCGLEIQLLEEKHHEEIRLYQIQCAEYKKQIQCLQHKLDQMQEKRNSIAQQLQKVMESQWSEALKIISGEKSPVLPNNNAFSTIDQLNSLKARSYNNLEEILSQEVSDDPSHVELNFQQNFTHSIHPNVQRMQNIDYNIAQNSNVYHGNDTPVSSKISRSKQEKENDIQKYIQLLLNRQPGNPTIEKESELAQKELGSNQRQLWSHSNQEDPTKLSSVFKSIMKERRSDKPPWK